MDEYPPSQPVPAIAITSQYTKPVAPCSSTCDASVMSRERRVWAEGDTLRLKRFVGGGWMHPCELRKAFKYDCWEVAAEMRALQREPSSPASVSDMDLKKKRLPKPDIGESD
jgi:hypothetical protein